MPNVSRLVDQLADLTAIRDLELLEFSLLRTLNSFLTPRGLRLLKVDSKNRPRMEIAFGNAQCTVKVDGIELAREIRAAVVHLSDIDSGSEMLRSGDDLLTVFALHATRATRTYLLIFTSVELSKLDAHLVSGMLQIYRNFCELLHDSRTDKLTGLANRKTFDECIHKVYELIVPDDDKFPEEKRTGKPATFWLTMIDIDHFKKINDQFGHLYGDEVLVLLGQLIKGIFREDDMLFRFGGEEFALILRCHDQAGCRKVLERLRTSVENRMFPQIGKVTISLGATKMVRETFAITLLDHADQALYFSKGNGRNQLTFFEDMLAAGVTSVKEVVPGGISYF